MRNAGLEEAQAGIKIAGRTTNNLRYADDTALIKETSWHCMQVKKQQLELDMEQQTGSK